jgi:thymidylate synthase (FAD)
MSNGDQDMNVELIAITRFLRGDGTADELLEFAGRVCYRSAPRGDAGDFVMKRVREGHESIIEHASATFLIEGISRACSHQIVRHRLASYSQESQRYVEMTEPPAFVIPPAIAADGEALAIWDQFVAQARDTYQLLRQRGIRKEDSRFLLPNASTTRLVMTMNFRSLRHFFDVRCRRDAQWEIRDVALAMLRKMNEVSPSVFGDQYQEFIG